MRRYIYMKSNLNWQKYWDLYKYPLMIATLSVMGWFIIHFFFDFSIIKEDDSGLGYLISLIAVAHGIIAGFQITIAGQKNTAIEQSLYRRNWDMFTLNACTKMHFGIKSLLFLFSVFFFTSFVLYPFKSDWSAVYILWLAMFALYSMWKIAIELDDPFNGIYKLTLEVVKERFNHIDPAEVEREYEILSNIGKPTELKKLGFIAFWI